MASQAKKKRKVAAVTPFASFMGIKAETPSNEDEQARRAEKEEEWAKKAETDPDREQMEDESDDDYATRMEEMDDEEEAEGEIKDEPEAEEQDEEKAKAKAVRASERARCAQIVAFGIKSGNINQAAVLAFDTSLSATQAISTMKATQMDVGASATTGGLGSRMNTVTNHNLGNHMNAGSRHRNKDEAVASSILSSVNAARGMDEGK